MDPSLCEMVLEVSPLWVSEGSLDFALEHTVQAGDASGEREMKQSGLCRQLEPEAFGLPTLVFSSNHCPASPPLEMQATVPLRDNLEPKEVSPQPWRPLWVKLRVETWVGQIQLELNPTHTCFPQWLCGSLLGIYWAPIWPSSRAHLESSLSIRSLDSLVVLKESRAV